MMPINSGFSNPMSQMDPSKMQDKFQQGFQAADVDKNGSLSKTEASEAMAGKGMDESKFNKMFDRMDTDGNGEVSQQEQDEMLKNMQERMDRMRESGGGGFGSQAQSAADSTLTTLLESLASDEDDANSDDEFNELLERIKTDGMNEQTRNQSMDLVNKKVATVNVFA